MKNYEIYATDSFRKLFETLDKREQVLFVSFASKKDQQKIIDFILENKDELFNLLRSF